MEHNISFRHNKCRYLIKTVSFMEDTIDVYYLILKSFNFHFYLLFSKFKDFPFQNTLNKSLMVQADLIC